MKKILEFDDFLESDLELDEAQKGMLRDWITKYEKYFNFHDSGSFIDSIDDITNDAIAQLGIDKSKHDAVQDYLESLYDLSDGISVIMAPGIEFQYTNIDQVQRFQY
jgi:hypothetical protein